MGMKALLQRISAALMVPLVILPIAAIYLAIGSQLGLAAVEAAGRAILLTYLPLVFAVGVTIAFTRQEGMAALAAVVGYVVFASVLAAIDKSIDMGVLGGITIGAVTSALYFRFHTIKFPEYLGLFSGKRFIPVAASLAGLVLGVVFGYVWPPVQRVIFSIGEWITVAGASGMFVYGILNRLLIPTGLHHIINNLIMYVFGSFVDPRTGQLMQGEVPRFYAGDPNSGYFLAGFYITCMFAIPAICLAIAHESRPEHRKRVTGLMVTAALTSLITGITEPAEFAFMFAAPALYALHALFTGSALWLTYVLGVRHYGFALPLYLINWGLSSRAWLILPIGLAYGIGYYALFRYAIRRFNLPVLGRETVPVEGLDSPAGTRAARILVALGGRANLLGVDACMTRLRVTVADPSLVDEAALRAAGASGVVRLGGGLVQAVMGTESEAIRDELKPYLGGTRIVEFVAPLSGRIVPLTEVPDQVFAQGLAGDGVAIDPTEGVLVSPCRGQVVKVFPGGHALGLVTPEGLEVILHVGLDTVELEGRGFKVIAPEGARVAPGDVLVMFDPAVIRAAGKSLLSPVVVANPDHLARIEPAAGVVRAGTDRAFLAWLK